MATSTMDCLAHLLCPGFLRSIALRLRKDVRVRLGKLRVVSTLEQLDREIARLDDLTDADEQARLMNQMIFDYCWSLPTDRPESLEYQKAVMESYYQYSGRASYRPAINENIEFAPESLSIERPFPYATGSSRVVGEHLMANGFLLRTMNLSPGTSILEFGPGWGNATIDFARIGCRVTAVDINPTQLQFIQRRALGLPATVEVACSDMLEYRPTRKYDRILFFACFHHCSDPVRMLDRLADWLAPGGMVVFASEPITDGFPIPWGLRSDGMSAYCIRKYGWFELGFNARFFSRLLTDRNWKVTKHQSLDQLHINVFLATRDSQTPRQALAA